MNGYRWHAPLDPACPDNPLVRNEPFAVLDDGTEIWEDPMDAECGCMDEINDDAERRHLASCARCQEYGAANIEVVGP